VHATSQAAFVDSDKLSKSKPLGILRLAALGIILIADDACSRQQEESLHMFARLIQICSALLFASTLAASSPVLASDDGIVTAKSAYPMGETIERLKKDIADKGIKFFDEIDQSKLAADAGITLRPSVLLIFGTHRSARSSSRRTRMQVSTGQCGFSSTKTRKARCGQRIPISTGSHTGTESRTEKTSLRWPRV